MDVFFYQYAWALASNILKFFKKKFLRILLWRLNSPYDEQADHEVKLPDRKGNFVARAFL